MANTNGSKLEWDILCGSVMRTIILMMLLVCIAGNLYYVWMIRDTNAALRAALVVLTRLNLETTGNAAKQPADRQCVSPDEVRPAIRPEVPALQIRGAPKRTSPERIREDTTAKAIQLTAQADSRQGKQTKPERQEDAEDTVSVTLLGQGN